MSVSAIILAAGAGTRMRSKKPKVAHEMLGKPLVRWVIDAAKLAGVSQVVSVVGHGREHVVPLVESDTRIVVQKNLVGTADAVACCEGMFSDFEGSMLVLTGDSPLITSETIKALIAKREKEQASAVVLTMTLDDPFGYGRIIRDENGQVERIIEQKDCTEEQALVSECNSGFYCFDSKSLFEALEKVGNANAQGEYYLTDVLEICRDEGGKVLAVQTDHPDECLGVNSRMQLAEATKLAQHRINTAFMAEGVTMTDPGMVWIGPDVSIDADVELLPMTFLYGNTEVGEGSLIGPNSRLTNTVVGKACVVDETVAVDTLLEDEVHCGPRSYLRPGTHLCCKVKVGTHVEIKKSCIGEGSKVPHLSYIGDTVMGSHSNIGAGTITCNYDGEHKSQTDIGHNVFVGSDVMLVAPVTLGDDSVIGAGSVITEDVSAGALALERSKQIEIKGWKASRKKRTEESQ